MSAGLRIDLPAAVGVPDPTLSSSHDRQNFRFNGATFCNVDETSPDVISLFSVLASMEPHFAMWMRPILRRDAPQVYCFNGATFFNVDETTAACSSAPNV